MQKLPRDIIRHIAQYLDIHQLAKAEQATKDFRLPHTKRKKRFTYCLNQMNPRKIKNGKCADDKCNKRKLSCIRLNPNPIETQYLSMYCSKHLELYIGININDLI